MPPTPLEWKRMDRPIGTEKGVMIHVWGERFQPPESPLPPTTGGIIKLLDSKGATDKMVAGCNADAIEVVCKIDVKFCKIELLKDFLLFPPGAATVRRNVEFTYECCPCLPL